jgi:hypothetical protein
MVLQWAVYSIPCELVDGEQDQYKAKFIESSDVNQGRCCLEAINGLHSNLIVLVVPLNP